MARGTRRTARRVSRWAVVMALALGGCAPATAPGRAADVALTWERRLERRPEAPPPVPVVVFMHGCTGIWTSDTPAWVSFLASHGYAVVAPDSFARPGRLSNCDPHRAGAGRPAPALRRDRLRPGAGAGAAVGRPGPRVPHGSLGGRRSGLPMGPARLSGRHRLGPAVPGALAPLERALDPARRPGAEHRLGNGPVGIAGRARVREPGPRSSRSRGSATQPRAVQRHSGPCSPSSTPSDRPERRSVVPKGGLEPPRVAPHAPQTCASASSATSARGRRPEYTVRPPR